MRVINCILVLDLMFFLIYICSILRLHYRVLK
jgi:hypothetical protein